MALKPPFVAELDRLLKPAAPHGPLVLDLFAGCGGLGLGFEAAGFETLGYEMNPDAADSYTKNLRGECRTEFITNGTEFPPAAVIIGGPPCQPFSVGGSQRGELDSRNGFPALLSAVRHVRPAAVLIENVRGMLYRNRHYLAEVLVDLESLGYRTFVELLNAKHHGVPQNRERVIIVATHADFEFPARQAALRTAGEALGEMAFSTPPESRFLEPNQDKYIAKYERASKCKNPRDLALDRPARTLTCRNLAGATGDMHRVRLPDGRRRRLTVREAARLQTFPDWFEFAGSETSAFEQIGNAVPPLLAFELAKALRRSLAGNVEVTRPTLF